jgi:tetratricopeptide (TPR) repeat protein
MYGAQTQFGVAPGMPNPGMPNSGMPPPAASLAPGTYPPNAAPALTAAPYPLDRGGAPGFNNNQRTIVAVLVSVIVIVAVLIGGSIVLSKAFNNFKTGTSSTESAEQYGKATNLYQFGDYESAAVEFNRVRMNPGVPEDLRQKSMQNEVYCYRQLAHKAQQDGDLITAQKWYQSALTVEPGDSQTQEEMAAVQRQQNANNPNGVGVPFGGSTTANDGRPGATLDGAVPVAKPNVPPSNITTNDFEAQIAAKEASAAPLLQQAKDFDSRGDYVNAQLYYHKAMEAGPGSNSAIEASSLLAKSLVAHPDNSLTP